MFETPNGTVAAMSEDHHHDRLSFRKLIVELSAILGIAIMTTAIRTISAAQKSTTKVAGLAMVKAKTISFGSKACCGKNICYFVNQPKNASTNERYRMLTIHSTWKSELGPEDFFYTFVENNESTFLNKMTLGIQTNKRTGYQNLHFKAIEFWNFVSNSDTTKHCDFVMQVDSDTYVNSKALRHSIIDRVNATDLYYGGFGYGTHCGTFAHSSILVSRGLLKMSKDWWKPCIEYMEVYQNFSWYGDVAFKCCLSLNGVHGLNETIGIMDPNDPVVIEHIRNLEQRECVVIAHPVEGGNMTLLHDWVKGKNVSHCSRL